MKNIVIDFQSIIDTINSEFYTIKNSSDKFSDIEFEVGNEQFLAKTNMDKPNFIYILVRFGNSVTNFGQAVVPVTLEILGLNNEIDLTQEFLNTFANEYNRMPVNNATQLWLSPSVSTNMNPIYNGWRSLFLITGSFVIDNSLFKIKELRFYPVAGENNQYEVIETIAFSDHGENSLNPQPYSDTNGRARSYGNFQTLGFSIVTYPDSDSALIQKIWNNKYDFTEPHQNDSFRFTFLFEHFNLDSNGVPQETVKKEFKLHTCDFNQKIGETPVLTATFIL